MEFVKSVAFVSINPPSGIDATAAVATTAEQQSIKMLTEFCTDAVECDGIDA